MGAKKLGRVVEALRNAWAHLRNWSGDDAYERYLEHHSSHHQGEPATRAVFYKQYFDARAQRPRCC
jgi:uncharacterized short protein YbdD (DUF466 family)